MHPDDHLLYVTCMPACGTFNLRYMNVDEIFCLKPSPKPFEVN